MDDTVGQCWHRPKRAPWTCLGTHPPAQALAVAMEHTKRGKPVAIWRRAAFGQPPQIIARVTPTKITIYPGASKEWQTEADRLMPGPEAQRLASWQQERNRISELLKQRPDAERLVRELRCSRRSIRRVFEQLGIEVAIVTAGKARRYALASEVAAELKRGAR